MGHVSRRPGRWWAPRRGNRTSAGRRALAVPADLTDLDVAAGLAAAAIVFLASPASGHITGKILEVDGGMDRPNLDLAIPDL